MNRQPWQSETLKDWAICGMNHYHVQGKRLIFVSMTKDGRCITAEGLDNEAIWESLVIKATKAA